MTPAQTATEALAGVLGRKVRETSIAVLDFETTGMRPGYDRVVEAAVVRIDPGAEPRLVFDSLINPGRPMACTDVHGITDAAVASAPTFADVAGDFAAAIEGCVVAAYNVAFDAMFLHYELANAGCDHRPPLLCLMNLRPLLGIGVRCKLAHACRVHRIDHRGVHSAAGDAIAAAGLMAPCLEAMERRGVESFQDLAQLGRHRFLESFVCSPLPATAHFGLRRGASVVARGAGQDSPTATPPMTSDYGTLLIQVLSTPNLSDAELSRIREERARSGMKADLIRAMHAQLFAEAISQVSRNGRIDRDGAELLRRTNERLRALGWAPGD